MSPVPARKKLAANAAALISKASSLRPALALVLGSGFNAVESRVQAAAELPYDALPGFPLPAVDGHRGKLLVGEIAGVPVIVLSGRAHFYEGHSFADITFPMRVLAEYGVGAVLLTNAAGGINPKFRPGDFMAVTDHLNFMGANPLRDGELDGRNRFVDLSQAYDPYLAKLLAKAARQGRIRLHAGVYVAVSGPCYETPAEIRAFARLGADAIGMSTVPEVIVARQCGLRVAALSCITNAAAGLGQKTICHEEVLATGERVQGQAADLLCGFVRLLAHPPGIGWA